jgi:integral membrane protein
MQKSRSQLIQIGHWEGISFLILLFIAMPLKYMYDFPLAVRLVGGAHGVLFVLFAFVLFKAYKDLPISIGKTILIFILSFLPFGTFFINKVLGQSNDVDYLNM